MITCPARGQTGKGNIHIHSVKDKRCLCDVCGQTFTTTKGTIFYWLRTNPEIVMCVIVLLAYGCPIQAIVKAFQLDERTVRDWHKRAGQWRHGAISKSMSIWQKVNSMIWSKSKRMKSKRKC